MSGSTAGTCVRCQWQQHWFTPVLLASTGLLVGKVDGVYAVVHWVT
jgi:hypothetical protein